MKFFTSFEPNKCEPCPTGNGKEINWKLKSVKGVDELVEDGEIDIYARIQAQRDQCDINALIDLYCKTGDTSLIEPANIEYYDLTQIPKDIFDMQDMIKEAQLKFDQLPAKIKQDYDNNLYNFINDDKAFDNVKSYFNDYTKMYADKKKADEDRFFERMKSATSPKSEVKDNE